MTVNVSDIKTKNWSMSKDVPGEIVTDNEDIHQCILIIVTTIPGSDPYNILFGCNIYQYQDQPANIAIPNMTREIGLAIATYEPRATVTNIEVELDEANLKFSIYWTSSFGDSVTTVPITLNN